MTKAANPGAMRTLISIYAPPDGKDVDGYRAGSETPICQDVYCKWVNKHGTDVLAMRQLGLQEAATVTMRYRADVQPDCIIKKHGDPSRPFDVVGVDNVDDRGAWMEITVARKVKST